MATNLHAVLDLPRRDFDVAVDLAVGAGTVALVGPSGAGKSSVLRAIAGLERPRDGRIEVDGDAWFDRARRVDLPPDRRAVGMVFQDHALFPHMTVAANVAFGAPAAAARRDAAALLDRLGVGHLAHARPGTLSGGERQRVALARALARRPRVLLLDEPLGALDAHTRAHVRDELRAVLAPLGLPVVLVTHDFAEAAALADRIVVVRRGVVVQEGTPAGLVRSPAHPFTAALTGASLLPGTAAPGTGGLTEVTLDVGGTVRSADVLTGRVGVVVSPRAVVPGATPRPGGADNVLHAPVDVVLDLGDVVRVRAGGLGAEIPAAAGPAPAVGATVAFTFPVARTRLVALGDGGGTDVGEGGVGTGPYVR